MRMPAIVVFVWGCVFWGILVPRAVAAQEPPSLTELRPPSAIDREIQELTEEAVARFKKGEFDEALALLRTAAEKYRDLPPAQVMMAHLYGQVNQRAGVQRALEKATVEAPDDPEAYVILGDFALRDRRVTEAYLCYDKANSLLATFSRSPKRKKLLESRVAAGLAAVAEAREQWPKAQKHLETWLKLEPENAVAMQRLGRALFKQKKVQEAKDMLKKAAQADPEVLNWAAQLALLYEGEENHEAANKWVKHAMELKPNDFRTRLAAAACYLAAGQRSLEAGQLDEAREHSAEALRIAPQWPEARVFRRVVALCDKDYETAERFFEATDLQSLGNFSPSRAYYFARVLLDHGCKEEAKRLLEAAVQTKFFFLEREQAEALLKELSK